MGGQSLGSAVETTGHPYNSAVLPHSLWFLNPSVNVNKSQLLPMSVCSMHTVSQKRDLYTFAHNFGRCWRIFEIFPNVVEFIKKFATNCLSHCPPHLKRVATLPCEMTVVISQGSVATRLRCDGQCDRQFVVNFLTNSTMEKFRQQWKIRQHLPKLWAEV